MVPPRRVRDPPEATTPAVGVNDTPDTDADKPDYLFRLAEQYALQLRHWRLRATEAEMQRE